MSELNDIIPKTADAVWVAGAILHRENPDREAFKIKELAQKVKDLFKLPVIDGTIDMHISSHCVANTEAKPDRHRILYRIDHGLYRLYRLGDPYDYTREGGKTTPFKEAIPPQYHELLDWYKNEYCDQRSKKLLEAKRTEIEPSFARITDGYVKVSDAVRKRLKLREGDHILFAENTENTMIVRKAQLKYK